ncbi:DUF5610 domain-containing protein [Hydrogenovibrio halophilus]|uniref:DUF5610 domain-containing protein n=1 Tax=Hydrogenovibrio halophilus TaxID=373391 RepID=UPI0012FD1C80|nr:DUF5610 domain-containing protein [Hydrogenovibrio halophilus]
MAISNIPAGAAAYSKHSEMPATQVSNQTPAADKSGQGSNQSVNSSEVRQQNQASLVSHLFGDGKRALEGAMKMTFQATMEQLNQALEPDLGPEAISQARLQETGIEYWNPENTADRIFQGASGFLPAFQRANPDLEGEALMDKYMNVVGGGLQKGFDEAKGILGEMKLFEGNIADSFQETMDRVFKSMENFRREQLGLPPLKDETAPAQDASAENAEAAAPEVSSGDKS